MEITETVSIHIDGKPYQAQTGRNLLEACLALGFDVPHFCWHPALGSVGACRQCAVKRFRDENDQGGEIIMACMTPVTPGLRISIHDPEVLRFRAAVIEWLMINHPHDCPVCDEGGECHLQDMTVMTGHTRREYRFRKRTHRNQYLGPFIHHEMNRCIQCYRCVRFYRNIAGGRDLNVFGAHDHVYFGRHQDGVLESEFSGNLVEICPTGTFTDKTQKAHNTRIWDLQTAPSICVHCGLGCNTLPGERYGQLRRVRNRYHHEINGYFLCDRGRFGYEFVNSDKRLRTPLYRPERNIAQREMRLEELFQQAVLRLKNPGTIMGIGSPRASLEANYALRSLVGPENFYAGVTADEHALLELARTILTQGPARAVSVQEAARSDAVLVLGEDLTQTAPLLALALGGLGYQKAVAQARKVQLPAWDDAAVRQFGQEAKPALFIATPQPTRLDQAARTCVRAAPHEIAALGLAVQAELSKDSAAAPEAPEALAPDIAQALAKSERPLIVTGTSLGSPAMVQAAADIARALCRLGKSVGLICCVPECNSMGLALLQAKNLSAAFQKASEGRVDTVIVLENDLYRRAPAQAVDAFLQKAGAVMVLDHLRTPTSLKADMVIPVATFAQTSGTLVNNEGRAQRFHAVFPADETIPEAFRLLVELKQAAFGQGRPHLRPVLEDQRLELSRAFPVFSGLAEPLPSLAQPAPGGKVPRQSMGYSGRTAIHAAVSVHEPKPPHDPDAPLAFSMEGYEGQPPPELITHYHAPGWNSVQALLKYQSIAGGPLKGGSYGRRLFLQAPAAQSDFFEKLPPAIDLKAAERLLVPLHHLFGSEELSMAAPAVAQLAPLPYLALNPEDPLAEEGREVLLTVAEQTLCLKVKVMPGLCRGVAGLPMGLAGIPVVALPAQVVLTKGDAT